MRMREDLGIKHARVYLQLIFSRTFWGKWFHGNKTGIEIFGSNRIEECC
jgi:hypothetical protein